MFYIVKGIPNIMYKIPKDGDVVLAIRNVLARYKTVHSLRELKRRVEQELNFGNEDYRASEERIRKLAIISGIADITVHTKSTGKDINPAKCPVCNSDLRASRNMTVYGKTVTVGYKCPECGYWTEKGDLRMPSRYEFSVKRRR